MLKNIFGYNIKLKYVNFVKDLFHSYFIQNAIIFNYILSTALMFGNLKEHKVMCLTVKLYKL